MHTLERIAVNNKNDFFTLFKNIVYKQYFFKKRIKIPKKTIKIKQSDVLVTFFPYRYDYELLIYPVIENLIKNKIKVTLIIPRKGLNSKKLKELIEKMQILIYEDLLQDFNTYKKINNLYIREWKKIKGNQYYKKYNSLEVKKIILNYAYDVIIGEKVVNRIKPKLVYGVHFILNPGLLEVFKGNNIKIHLIQHGFFNGRYHDFIGSDLVYLWGKYHQKRLFKLDSQINSVVVGNPKILEIKHMYEQKKLRREEKLTVLIVSSGHTFSDTDQYNSTLQIINIIKSFDDNNFKTIFKLHPNENIDDYSVWINGGILKKNEIVKNKDIYQLIFSSDIVIGSQTTVVNEAAYFKKVAIRYGYNGNINEIDDGIIKINDQDYLKKIILLIKNKKEYEKVIKQQSTKVNDFFYNDCKIVRTISLNISQSLYDKC